MSDAPESPQPGDLTVLEAWQILVKPAPTRPAASHVGLFAIVGLLNLSAIAAIVAVSVPDPNLAIVAGLFHTTLIPGALLAFALVPTDEVDAVEWLTLALGFGLAALVLGGLMVALLPVRVTPITVVGWTAVMTLVTSAFAFRRGMSWRLPATGGQPNLIAAGLIFVVAACLRLPGL